jgi:nucleoside-diphosphate-sugar epimerase
VASRGTVLIAGCGYVGTALALQLAGAGHTVYGLRRDPSGLPEPVKRLAGDLADPASLDRLPSGIDVVFYTAAADDASESAYQAAYLTGLSNLIAALVAGNQSPRRLFFTSSTSVYAQSDGSWVDELSPVEPTRHTGRLVLEGEGIALSSPWPATVVRLGGIYGPGRIGLFRRLEQSLGDVPIYGNRIHRDDCAGVLAHLMEVNSSDPVYLAVDSAPEDRWAVLMWLAEQLGVKGPTRGQTSQPPRSNKRCSNRRLLSSGYVFRYPTFKDGYRPLVSALSG